MPRISKPPADATELWRWMHKHRVTIDDLAEALHISPNHLGLIRRGVQRPTVPMIEEIAEVTKAIETKLKVKPVRGVEPRDWFA
jgi:transcriptional regulator with XRE-family HTH domain